MLNMQRIALQRMSVRSINDGFPTMREMCLLYLSSWSRGLRESTSYTTCLKQISHQAQRWLWGLPMDA